jgi:hypothetical protein
VNDIVLDQLAALGLDYDVADCDPDLADTAAFCEAYGHPGAHIVEHLAQAAPTT